MKPVLTLLFLSLHALASAQNLVPNPGFEKFFGLPQGFSSDAKDFTDCVKDWKVPNTTTPDYVAPFFPRGNAVFGDKHAGFGMLGLDIASNWAECVYAKLEPEMEANTTYALEFWIKRSMTDFQKTFNDTPSDCPPGYVSPDFGLLLSDTLQLAKNKEFIVGTPQLRCGPKFWVDKDWIKVSGIYTTDKTYRYVYAGQFRPEGQTGPLSASRYVLIDDIQIKKVTFSNQSLSEAMKKPGAIIPLDEVYFETGKSVLEERSFAVLDTLAGILKSSDVRIRVNGHTDNQGSVDFNTTLSKERAKAVYTYLIFKGVSENRLSWEGFGASKPKADNTTEAGRQKNRRVEFEIMPP